MKLLQITALALCLNTPMALANDEQGCYSRFGREDSLEAFSIMIGAASVLGLYGMYCINSALNTSRENTPLLPTHTTQTPENNTLHDIRKGFVCAAVGAAFATGFWIYMTTCESIAYNNKCK